MGSNMEKAFKELEEGQGPRIMNKSRWSGPVSIVLRIFAILAANITLILVPTSIYSTGGGSVQWAEFGFPVTVFRDGEIILNYDIVIGWFLIMGIIAYSLSLAKKLTGIGFSITLVVMYIHLTLLSIFLFHIVRTIYSRVT